MIYETLIEGGKHWSLSLGAGTSLRLVDEQGGANVGMLFYNPRNLLERYNAPDTLKCQHTFKLTRGHCLYSDMGRIFCSIVADDVGWHDTVGGNANPTSVELAVQFEGDEVIAHFVLRRAFEGAPGRAHGGIVAAAFDDVTGFVIGRLQEPAFTGELTVRYLAAVPVDQALEIRARLDGRERRKLFISAELYNGDDVVATCRATYITVELSRFAGAPDPR